MKYFLSPQKRADLAEVLKKLEVTDEHIKMFIEVPDDLDEVDSVMLKHVLCVAHFRNIGRVDEASKGLCCLSSLMAEAVSRGLGKNDLPRSLAAIKDDLASKGITSIQ